MLLKFFKYQATGNDFIMVDNRQGVFPENDPALISRLCHRKFGIGADGIILLEEAKEANFTMVYYNPDGSQSFCGNGSRAAVHFARSLGMLGDSGSFVAIDGIHQAKISGATVQVNMANVSPGKEILNGVFYATGSPHYVTFVDHVDRVDVVAEGRSLRHHQAFQPGGSNINFVEITGADQISVRTYERGVEDETLSCGTGVTAAAIAASVRGLGNKINITTPGGNLQVGFTLTPNGFTGVWLSGPATLVFSGELTL